MNIARMMNHPWAVPALVALLAGATACTVDARQEIELSDSQAEELVRRSYPYVALYNVHHKFALAQGGWNTVVADTRLKDHTLTDIARPNNDTLYIGCLLDVREQAIVLDMPAFDSEYVSLMITSYDHYVNVPMSTRLGDFDEPARMLVYSARTEGYEGEQGEEFDRSFEAASDFVGAVLRVMPHASDPERLQRILEQMKAVRLVGLSELRGGPPLEIGEIDCPPFGQTDFDVFEQNLLPVMQFVFDHTTFDAADALDRALLAAYEPLGVAPGRGMDPEGAPAVDGARLRSVAERIAGEELRRATDPEFQQQSLLGLFLPKGQMTLDLLVFQSVIGPIGLPAVEAAYPAIETADGAPLNAGHDYVVRMGPDELPPAGAFWSLTLYDMGNGFFIPNDRKKYSVGLNAGMQLDEQGGIEVHVAAEQPEGVPEENWLPIERKDLDLSLILRIYEPDLEKLKTWKVPVAERL
jgi:hypothetical protein